MFTNCSKATLTTLALLLMAMPTNASFTPDPSKPPVVTQGSGTR